MQEQQYVSQEDSGQTSGLARFLIGLFTGIVTAAPITALAVKKWCDKEKEKAVEEAENRGIQAGIAVAVEESAKGAGSASRAISEPNRSTSEGMNLNRGIPEGHMADAGAESDETAIPVYVEGEQVGKYTADGMVFNTTDKTEETATASTEKGTNYDEAYLASLQSPPDDHGIDYDLENYNLTIDDEEASQEAAEFSDSRVKYLDMVEKYRDRGGGIPPMTISREQFENEHFHEKSYINYYPDDDTFAEDDNEIEDPNYTFGFTSGKEMFAPERTANREDPDICYIRNMACSTDFEITRMHGSFTEMVKEGKAYYRP